MHWWERESAHVRKQERKRERMRTVSTAALPPVLVSDTLVRVRERVNRIEKERERGHPSVLSFVCVCVCVSVCAVFCFGV